jgi:hypothetical protein
MRSKCGPRGASRARRCRVDGGSCVEGVSRKDRTGDQRGGREVNGSRYKFFLKRTRPISQSQLRGSHTNKWKHTQTSLDTLGTKLERLRSKAGAKTKELEQHRGRQRPTISTSRKVWVTLRKTEPHQVTRPQIPDQPTPSGRQVPFFGPGTAQETARELASNFRSMDLPNHLEFRDETLWRWYTPQGEDMPLKISASNSLQLPKS